jgi:hypothetical protein
MSKRVNIDAVIAWLYVMETLDTCPECEKDGAYIQLVFDLVKTYPDEWQAVLAVRDAHRLMGGMK